MPVIEDFFTQGEMDNSWRLNREPLRGVANKEPTEKSTCSKCGRPGLEYQEWTKGYMWKSFQVCPDCHNAVEF